MPTLRAAILLRLASHPSQEDALALALGATRQQIASALAASTMPVHYSGGRWHLTPAGRRRVALVRALESRRTYPERRAQYAALIPRILRGSEAAMREARTILALPEDSPCA